jgi:hypothetical protein
MQAIMVPSELLDEVGNLSLLKNLLSHHNLLSILIPYILGTYEALAEINLIGN